MKRWHRKLHFILWLILLPSLIVCFWFSAYLLQKNTLQPDMKQQKFLEKIEQELNQE